MVSFDVVSLFTCVPTDLVVQVARRRLEKDQTLLERTDLSVDDIMDLLTLCLNATFLQFRGKVHSLGISCFSSDCEPGDGGC